MLGNLSACCSTPPPVAELRGWCCGPAPAAVSFGGCSRSKAALWAAWRGSLAALAVSSAAAFAVPRSVGSSKLSLPAEVASEAAGGPAPMLPAAAAVVSGVVGVLRPVLRPAAAVVSWAAGAPLTVPSAAASRAVSGHASVLLSAAAAVPSGAAGGPASLVPAAGAPLACAAGLWALSSRRSRRPRRGWSAGVTAAGLAATGASHFAASPRGLPGAGPPKRMSWRVRSTPAARQTEPKAATLRTGRAWRQLHDSRDSRTDPAVDSSEPGPRLC